jgi:hypothetical protein
VSSPEKKSDKPLTPRQAWQPLTPRGVAAFASATLTRLILVQVGVGVIVAASVIWFLSAAWFPVISEAVHHLPETGSIHAGVLSFDGSSPQTLSENARLAIVVDLASTAEGGRVADLAVTLEKDRLKVCGPLGCRAFAYDNRYVIGMNRSEAEAGWGAWQWPVLAVAGLATIFSLLVLWWSTAFLYLPLVKLIAFFGDRTVTARGAWKLSGAALLPGALVVALSIILYGFGAVDLLRFALLFALHIVCGLVFAIASPCFLAPVTNPRSGKNPFDRAEADRPPKREPSPFSKREQK